MVVKTLIMRLVPVCMAMAAVSCRPSGLCDNDANAPVGWATCQNMEGERYDLTGGFRNPSKGVEGKAVTLHADGDSDMRLAINKALEENDIVILDGSQGPFIYSRTYEHTDLRHKTVVGINGAVLRTRFQFDSCSRALVRNAEEYYSDKARPDENGVWHLPNGETTKTNYAAFAQRMALIEHTGDNSESFTHSGFWAFLDGCEDIIIRNITFDGPGTFRSYADFMVRCAAGAHNIWIDHCRFEDAARVAVGVTRQADFVSVTWTSFAFTDQSDGHSLANLISSSDEAFEDRGHLNVTFAHCMWDNVWSRVPMARFGKIHILNCLYRNPGTVGINPRTESQFLVEGCYFEPGVKPFCRYRLDVAPGDSWVFRNNVYDEGADVENKGESVAIPYAYEMTAPQEAREDVSSYAGPTLIEPLRVGRR